MSRLFLLRHAKAGWALPGVRDFDRPLDASGHADAEATGAAMRACGYVPDITLCSNARRARETLEGIAGHADTGRVLFFDKLYSEDAAGYLSLIQRERRQRLGAGHRPQSDDGGSRHGAFRRRRACRPRHAAIPAFRPPGWRSSAFPAACKAPRPATAISRPSHARRSLTRAAWRHFKAGAALPISGLSRRKGSILGDIADHFHRRGKDRARHAVRPRRRPVLAVAAARRDRAVARRQDRLHLGLRPQSRPWRPAAAVRGAEIGPHRPRFPGAAAGRRRAALPVRGPCRGAGERAHLARFDARHFRAAADHRV